MPGATSDVLAPSGDGLQPNSDGLHPVAFQVLVMPGATTSVLAPRGVMASNLIAMDSTLVASLLLVAMASNLTAMAST